MEDALALHRHLGTLEPRPFAYLQVKYVDLVDPPEPQLVPNSFELLAGALDAEAPYVFGDEALPIEAARWLSVLPGIVIDDTETWSVSVGTARRLRHVRLIVSRVKPAIRSILARRGVRPTTAFGASWSEMAELVRTLDLECASQIALLRSLLPPRDHGRTVLAGEVGLQLLWRLLSVANQ